MRGWLTPGRNLFGLYLYRKDVDGLAAAFKSETLEQGWAKRQAVGNVRVPLNGPDDTLVRVGWPTRLRD